MTQGWHVAMAEAKCALTHPKWPLSFSGHLLQQWLLWHLAGKEKNDSYGLIAGFSYFMAPRLTWVAGGSLFITVHLYAISCSSLPVLLKTPCFKEKQIIKQPEWVVFSLPSLWPSQHPAENLLYTCSKEGTLALMASGVSYSYFPASWGGGRRGIVWGVASYSDNDWSYQKLPHFRLIIKYKFFLSQIGTTGTTSQQQGEGTAPLTCWCAITFPFWLWLRKLRSKEQR